VPPGNLLVLGCFLVPISLAASTNLGRVSGKILDPRGARAQDASETAELLASGYTSQTTESLALATDAFPFERVAASCEILCQLDLDLLLQEMKPRRRTQVS
jgi:hypothetical protein